MYELEVGDIVTGSDPSQWLCHYICVITKIQEGRNGELEYCMKLIEMSDIDHHMPDDNFIHTEETFNEEVYWYADEIKFIEKSNSQLHKKFILKNKLRELSGSV